MSSLKTAAVGWLMLAAILLTGHSADTGEPAVPDRVGFPADYQAKYEVVRTANKTKVGNLGTIYTNDRAASVRETGQLPYPEGSVIVMEWAEPQQAADGTRLTGTDGLWRKGKVVRVDVMRRERGYGEAYGGMRSGEWEFASYQPDGSPFQPPVKPTSCAECHRKAGAERDFVFRGRFPPLGEQ